MLCSQNYRNFSQLHRTNKIFPKNVSSPYARIKTSFRFQSNQAEDRIKDELAQEFRQSMKITHLVRPLVFTVGVRIYEFLDFFSLVEL